MHVVRQLRKSAANAHKTRGYFPWITYKRGMGAGVRAAAGLIASGQRRVIVKARYTMIAGDLTNARKHIGYIVRAGVSRDGTPGRAYDAAGDDAEVTQFLRRSASDGYQFRFVVSAEDGARLQDLKPFIRGLLAQMQYDLESHLDWIAVDHFNTGHPHTHIVIRGRDDKGHDLVMAPDYLAHGIRVRARALVSLELGPESEMEHLQKLVNQVAQERFTLLDQSLLTRAKDGVLAIAVDQGSRPRWADITGWDGSEPCSIWGWPRNDNQVFAILGAHLEARLRQLGERADKFKMMQRALKQAGIERGAAALALFERGARKAPLLGKVVGVGMIDEITDRTWVAIDAVDGRVHYAELGRLKPADVPRRGNLVRLAAGTTAGKPSAAPKLELLSAVEIERQTSYEGPTWIDQALLANWRPDPDVGGFGAELRSAFAERLRWLRQRHLGAASDRSGDFVATTDMLRALRQLETQRLVAALSHELGATYVPPVDGRRISGIYERSIVTPTARLALIRREDTFTLAPWKPALEAMRGRAVIGLIGPHRVTWTLDRGRALPELARKTHG